MSDADRDWTPNQRRAFWVKLISMTIPLAGAMTTCALAGGKWVYTRASTDAIAKLDATKEDKQIATSERRRIETKVDGQTQLIGNVRDNLIILMERQRAQPKPLPPALPDPVLPARMDDER